MVSHESDPSSSSAAEIAVPPRDEVRVGFYIQIMFVSKGLRYLWYRESSRRYSSHECRRRVHQKVRSEIKLYQILMINLESERNLQQ